MNTRTILVTGGTGKTGRRIVQRLAGSPHAVRVGSRSATPSFEWSNEGTWEAALKGVDAAYVCYYPDVAARGAAETIASFVDAARRAGVSRLVLLSGRGEPEAQRCEEIVARSGVDWTLLRASWFAQNFSENFLLEPLLAGEVVLPAGDVGEPFVDADDIAEIAVKALTEDGHAGQLYEITGPRLWSFAQAVAEIGRAAGRDIRYVQVPVADYAAALREASVPADIAELVTYLFSEVLDGRNASVADGVQRALGRLPRDFTDYARAAAATGVWAPSAR
ncbi:MAG TPA: NAD(P)H-binding protein [Vicinamibacterales bacterium]|nr:NAD(P)H-binding protein [Vicinamibacterales bacterium]